jgi:hypothetical protein
MAAVSNDMVEEGGKTFYVDPVTGGKKEIKPERFGLIPTYPLRELAKLYARGAIKYGDHNWRKGYKFSASFDALNRHLLAWWDGEKIDPENGLHHLTSVAWHAFALMCFERWFPDKDDRVLDPGEASVDRPADIGYECIAAGPQAYSPTEPEEYPIDESS